MADAGTVKALPIELLAGIDLAMRCDVRMRQHGLRPHAVARHDVERELFNRNHLSLRENQDSHARGRGFGFRCRPSLN